MYHRTYLLSNIGIILLIFFKISSYFSEVTLAGPQSSFIFYAAYNKSDSTTGTLQFVDGMTLFYWFVNRGFLKELLENQFV